MPVANGVHQLLRCSRKVSCSAQTLRLCSTRLRLRVRGRGLGEMAGNNMLRDHHLQLLRREGARRRGRGRGRGRGNSTCCCSKCRRRLSRGLRAAARQLHHKTLYFGIFGYDDDIFGVQQSTVRFDDGVFGLEKSVFGLEGNG